MNTEEPTKKLKSPGVDPTANLNLKCSVTCANVPEGLFEAATAKKHFSKFGRVQKIRLVPKKHMCIIEYEQPTSAERAVLNAGAFDGFMFDVTRTKARVRRKSKKEDDPDWVPDSEVEEELSAMRNTPIYRAPRQKAMETESATVPQIKLIKRTIKHSPERPKLPVRDKRTSMQSTAASTAPLPAPVIPVQTTMSTMEAASELHQLKSRVSSTPDEQWRTLDARDRILRAWGGAGSRVKVGGATIGTCPDMCPEKELLHRQAEHQVMTLETVPDSDGQLELWRAVKQYSRSSADQEIPMCYELRPARVLMRTCAYLLHEIADTTRPVSLADWFHFLWDRLRGIRKDITQQALSCAESIHLVEMCARFHAHCAARLADLEHTQFDQKLNTDNLTKCLQTLKHMYADVGPEMKPREAEFRGYIALLNMGDANFWWEIKQLPEEIQKSTPIIFSMKVFNALDNNNYVRFFRLVREEATYLQACVLLRYFNDVRARALARIVKAFAPRGGSKYPVEELMNSLSFESIDSLKSFITHYGLRLAKDEYELSVILDRNQFIEDSDPYPIARAVDLIESKRTCSVGEVIAGGALPIYDHAARIVYSSFNKDGKLKESALVAEDQGYNTINDTEKDVKALKTEIQRLATSGRGSLFTSKPAEQKSNIFVKPDTRAVSPGKALNTVTPNKKDVPTNTFSFKPAITVAPTEEIKNSPEKIFDNGTKNIFSFAKPQETEATSSLFVKDTNVFKAPVGNNVFGSKLSQEGNSLFSKRANENKDPNSQIFKKPDSAPNIFKKPDAAKSVFGQVNKESSNGDMNRVSQNIFGKSAVSGDNNSGNIFASALKSQDSTDAQNPKNIFGSFNKPNAFSSTNNLFSKPNQGDVPSKPQFSSNGDVSPGTLFKSAINTESKTYSIFQTKNKASTAENIFSSANAAKPDVYEFDRNEADNEEAINQQKIQEEQIKAMERAVEEKMREEEENRKRIEEEKRKHLEEEKRREEKRIEEERKRQEELKRLEEKRKREEEKKQEELKRKLEEERKAELKRKAEEEERKFREKVETESKEVTDELLDEVQNETVKQILLEELEEMKNVTLYAQKVTDEICIELCDEISRSETTAQKFWADKLRRKWFNVWRSQFHRNTKRRDLLDGTPVWLPDRPPIEEAKRLRRSVESSALKNMNAVHKGYKFVGELIQWPVPESYNIMEIIRSPLLKRMKQIFYPYDKCFFWKVTIASPGTSKWMCRKVEIEKWLLDAFSDKKKHDASDSLIRVEKQSWNNLMDFAISVSLVNSETRNNCSEAVNGSNGLMFYTTENDDGFITSLEDIVKQKYPFQIIPVTVLMSNNEDSKYILLEKVLTNFVEKKLISCFKFFVVDPKNVCESLNANTKSALKWMAKKYPPIPPLEVDYLKSICQRYLGNEIWYRLKSERDARMFTVLKNLPQLINCYNTAVDKLTEVLTKEDLFNYPSFPLEFNNYLDHTSPYPKPFEFIPTNSRNSDNTSAIKDLMEKLKLPSPLSVLQPIDVPSMQIQMRKYCNQIGWFENPEEVVCKVVAKLPTQFADVEMSCEQFSKYFEHYDLIDFLNIVVYEKINSLQNFDNRFAVYEKSALEEYRNIHWLYEVSTINRMKHRPSEFEEDDLDMFIDAKRRKLALDSMEYLMLEKSDCTMVENNIKSANESIVNFSNCKDAVKQLEEQIELEKQKSLELENLLKSALSNV